MGICIYRYWKHELIFGKRCLYLDDYQKLIFYNPGRMLWYYHSKDCCTNLIVISVHLIAKEALFSIPVALSIKLPVVAS
jgi:hypothetical protein